nr:hypothetical protein [Tanacetum cinerariifolium]
MIALLNDLSYIPSNNEQNEPTQGDIGETSNGPTQAKHNEFEELYANANEELYPGYDYVTRLDFMAKFTYFKVKGKLTYSIFIEMLEFFQHVFPTMKGYKLPSSYYAIKKTFKTIGLGYESIHACVNDCFLFRGDSNKDVHFCLVCKMSRWKDNNTPRKKVPKKVLRYFPIIPRLQRLYKFSHTAKEMTWHATRKCTEPESSFMLTLLIPGLKSPGKDIDVYLRPLIDDLKTINDFPARSSLSGWSGQGYKACPTCNEDYLARRDLKRLGIRSSLWLGQTKNGKCSKPQAAYSFTPENRKKFCQFIKGVKLPDGFGSNFKHKVTDNDTNITGLKSHDCHIMMQHVLPYGLQQYFPDEVAKPIIELCSFFKQICYATLMEDDMFKAQSKVVDILCNLELIYPPAFFDIMIHLVIHLPLEALEGGPIRPQWMFPFERFMKKLKGYVRNNAKAEGSIAEGYVAEEALTFSSHYFWDVTTKFNLIRFDTQELKKVIWYVLHNSLKIDTYRSQFKRRQPHWKVIEHVNHKFFSDGGVIMVEEDPDVIHFDNSSDLLLSTSLNDLDNATLHIDGQSTKVDAPPYIIDLDEDDDIIDDEDALPHNLADSDDEDLVNVDDDDGVDMSANVARGHSGGSGGDDRPPTHHIPTGCGGCFANGGKGTRKPNLGRRKAGRLHTRQETRNLGLKKITNDKGPEMTLYYPSWQKVSAERKAAILTKIETQFDLTPHMKSQRWTNINVGIQQHLQNFYNTNKASLKAAHWVINPKTGTNQARAAQNRQNQAKSTVVCRQGSRSLACLRDQMMESSATREYPSLIHTFFVTHTVNGVFTRDVDRAIYEEMLRLQALGSNTSSGVPYTEEEINALARKGKQRGHLPGVDRVLSGRATNVLIPPPPQCTHNSGDVEKFKKKNKYLTKQVNLMMKLFRSNDKFSQMLNQYESTPEFGNASGSGGCGDDEMASDEDGGEDEEDEEDGNKDDPDVIHVDNLFDLALSTSLNDLEIAALHIDGKSIDLDAPSDIVDVDEDDDIIDEDDPIPYDLVDSNDEDLATLILMMVCYPNATCTDVAQGHGRDGGGDDRPPPHQIPTSYEGCLGNQCKGTRKPNLGGRRTGRMHTYQETQNHGLKAITDKMAPSQSCLSLATE